MVLGCDRPESRAEGELVKRLAFSVLIGVALLPVSATGATVAPTDQESLFELLGDLGSQRSDTTTLIGDATGLAETLGDCDEGAPRYTLFLPAPTVGRGALFDVLVDNSGRSLGELLARPAFVSAFVANHLTVGLVSETTLLDPAVRNITMTSGEVLTKSVMTAADGRRRVIVGGRTVIDGMRTIGHPNGYRACNGVVYLTDGIFNPRGTGRLSLLRSGPTLYERIMESATGPDNPVDLLIDSAGLGDGLRDCREEAPQITLFLPGPGAVGTGVVGMVLESLKESLGSLLARPDLVRELLGNHIVDDLVTPEELLDPARTSFTARSGLVLTKEIGSRANGSTVVTINGHEVVAGITTSRLGTTYETCSGALYFIDGFLSPERALSALSFPWRDAGRKWGDSRFRLEYCIDHVPWRPSCVDLP